VTIRRLKSKRGSSNRVSRHSCLKVELTKKHPNCLECVVVHEMTHYSKPNHRERCTKLMDKHLLKWRSCPGQLNEAPLAEEVWA